MATRQAVLDHYIAASDAFDWDDKALACRYMDALLVPVILFDTLPGMNGSDLTSSRFGGTPIGPDDFEWPRIEYGVRPPLSFYFQINFAELKPFDIQGILPEKGLLCCYAAVLDDAMHDPCCATARRIFFFPDPEVLSPQKAPDALPDEDTLPDSKIWFKSSYQLPSDEAMINALDQEIGLPPLTDKDAHTLEELAGDVYDEHICKCDPFGHEPMADDTLFSLSLILGSPADTEAASNWADIKFNDYHQTDGFTNIMSFRMNEDAGTAFEMSDADVLVCISRDELDSRDLEKAIMLIKNS